jgi:hypothetical protein
MEIIESIAWISIGFMPIFDCLEVTWRKAVEEGLKVDRLRQEEMVRVANVQWQEKQSYTSTTSIITSSSDPKKSQE